MKIATIPVVLNGASGPGHARTDVERLQASFRQAGLEAQVLTDVDLAQVARGAMRDRPRVLVAGGGDGTLNAVANVVRGTETALGVLPLGTLNHFAKDLGLPLELDAAVRVIRAGRRAAVDVGEVNGRAFLNNASLGIYPDIVRERTRQQRRFGRSKMNAMLWATLAAMNRAPLLSLRLELDQRPHECRAPFVFIGNNDYVMEGFNIGTRTRLDAGHLSVYTTQHCHRAGLLALAVRALFGRLRQAEDFTALQARTLRVETPHKRLLVATDGEVNILETPLEFRLLPRALQVIVP
jgi:diacylglycerol kinase family enzyme